MRFATVNGRFAILHGDLACDVDSLSDGRFAHDAARIYDEWPAFRAWAGTLGAATLEATGRPYQDHELGPPSPAPRQVFAIGLNYREHVAEVGADIPDRPTWPPTFTKYRASLTGPFADLVLPTGRVDWEVELVVIVGRTAWQIGVDSAWDHVAGLTVGQDYSERDVQRTGLVPQFSMGKSFPGFGPTGPWAITPDEVDDPTDLELSCSINGAVVQRSRTSRMIFSVAELIERTSRITPLLPGDLIFTGTPSGVGMGRQPEQYLNDGDVVVSEIQGIGAMRQLCTSSPA